MPFFRREIIVEAVRYEGLGTFDAEDVPGWIWAAFKFKVLELTDGKDPLRLRTQSTVDVEPGDWLVRDPNGIIVRWKPGDFEERFKPV